MSRSSSNARQERMHETLATYKMCIIYNGILQDGSISPGFISSSPGDHRPCAWVVPIDIWEKRNDRGTTSKEPYDDSFEAKLKFARENVRLVRINSTVAMHGAEINNSYIIRVPEPYGMASSGELVKKAGKLPSEHAVPDGKTKRDLDKEAQVANNSAKDIMRYVRGRYGSSIYPIPGAKTSPLDEEQFPKQGDVWH